VLTDNGCIYTANGWLLALSALLIAVTMWVVRRPRGLNRPARLRLPRTRVSRVWCIPVRRLWDVLALDPRLVVAKAFETKRIRPGATGHPISRLTRG
jgi:hypothetical protein